MGAVNSCCIPQNRDDDGTEKKKVKGHRRNLSATFNMSIMDDPPQNTININYAGEEELMTLPGINRTTAQNIIEYRKQIGGFKKIEDLALVSGVGAARLTKIRNEVCVTVKRLTSSGDDNSGRSSLSGSNKDLEVFTNEPTKKKNSKININTSNVFQLMKINGVGQVLAENIVTYRDKKGPFKSVDDLVRVKGIGNNILSAIRHQICLEDSEDPPTIPSNGDARHGSHLNSVSSNHNSGSCHRKHLTESVENILTILGPVMKTSKRHKVTPFNFKHKNKSVVRIASWNVERFDEEKANNPGVKEVVCMTILENG